MHFETRLTPKMIEQYTTAGYWPNLTICDYLDTAVAKYPDKVAAVDRFGQLTYRELGEKVDRVALGLLDLGIKKNDIVSLQLPNWNEFLIVHFALSRIGAVTNVIVPIFRHSEVKFMVGLCESVALLVPSEFRNFDYPGMVQEIWPDLPALKHVFVVGDRVPKGMRSFSEFMDTPWEKRGDRKALAAMRPDPNDVTEIIFTSGTTGEPKGVMHTHNTLVSPVAAKIENFGLGPDDVILMASTFAHQTGFLYGVRMPAMLGAKGVFMDIWNGDEAIALIEREGVTHSMGATPFLSDLTHSRVLSQHKIDSFRSFCCAGAPIPRNLVVDAQANLKIRVSAGWGMTENGLVTMNRRNDREEKVYTTDGYPLPGMEVKVVDADGKTLPPGEEGDLFSRGPFTFLGYFKRHKFTAETFTEGDWQATGDRARIDADGFVSIVGRSKDIIIRGGENISVAEVENILFTHPKIANVAIVGMPDARLQEKACAYVILKANATSLTLEEVIAFLGEHKLAKQKYPERLEIVDAFPMTASGKIQKFRLREDIKEKLAKE